jgi:SAM-dependent methyltransferase
MIEVATCPVCDNTSFADVYPASFSGNWRQAVPYFFTGRTKVAHGRIVRCTGCGFLFTSPQFSANEYARIYAAVHSDGGNSAPLARFKALARRVCQTESGGRFLDFGCGSGAFLDAMEGFDGIGFDVSADGAVRNGRILKGDILSESLSCMGLEPSSFDFIVAWDVLEHLATPALQMQRLRSLLKRGGRLYLTLPDSASWVARLSGRKWNMLLLEHLWYFDPTTVRRFLARCGLRVHEIRPVPYPVDLATLFLRARQTYGAIVPPAPALLANLVVSLPVGLMFVMASRGEE